jgi:hypothetical protein
MNMQEARVAIEAILDAIPDHALPEARIDRRGKDAVAQFGGLGYFLGTAKRGGELDPTIHRSHGIDDLFNRETVARIDAQYVADGTIPAHLTEGEDK